MDWREWDETWTMKCELKVMRWNINNEVDNVTSPSLSLMPLQVGQKQMLLFFFVCLWTNSIVQLAGIQLAIQHSSKYLQITIYSNGVKFRQFQKIPDCFGKN